MILFLLEQGLEVSYNHPQLFQFAH